MILDFFFWSPETLPDSSDFSKMIASDSDLNLNPGKPLLCDLLLPLTTCTGLDAAWLSDTFTLADGWLQKPSWVVPAPSDMEQSP